MVGIFASGLSVITFCLADNWACAAGVSMTSAPNATFAVDTGVGFGSGLGAGCFGSAATGGTTFVGVTFLTPTAGWGPVF